MTTLKERLARVAARSETPDHFDTVNEALARIEALEAAAKDSFTRGYLLAVSNLMNLHGSEVEAEDTLIQLGENEGVLKRLDLEDYDAKPLRRLFREISRKRRCRARLTLEGGSDHAE